MDISNKADTSTNRQCDDGWHVPENPWYALEEIVNQIELAQDDSECLNNIRKIAIKALRWDGEIVAGLRSLATKN